MLAAWAARPHRFIWIGRGSTGIRGGKHQTVRTDRHRRNPGGQGTYRHSDRPREGRYRLGFPLQTNLYRIPVETLSSDRARVAENSWFDIEAKIPEGGKVDQVPGMTEAFAFGTVWIENSPREQGTASLRAGGGKGRTEDERVRSRSGSR